MEGHEHRSDDWEHEQAGIRAKPVPAKPTGMRHPTCPVLVSAPPGPCVVKSWHNGTRARQRRLTCAICISDFLRREADPVLPRDAELLYQIAEDLAFCGQGGAALRQLRKSIQGNHCSYPAIDKDPLFEPIRQRPEFAEVRQAAVQCQQKFLSHRKQVDAALTAAQ